MVAAIACLFVGQAASAQSTGVITGRVTDVTSGDPISAVRVLVSGTTNGTLTGDDGRYTLRSVALGSVVIEVNRIGYEANKATVTVTAGAPAVANVTLKTAVFSLGAVVTTVTGPQRKVELGTTTASINVAAKIAEAPVRDMGALLSGRAAGVQVSSSGATGAGSRIRIRGQSSLSLGNDPLVYIDGIRANTSTSTGSTAAPSRFDDINPAEIESIEVLKGPSAATLYGTEAANGVINITTKKGKSGKTVWSVFTENGVINDPNKGKYPEMYYRWGTVNTVNSAGVVTKVTPNTGCRLTQIAAGLCVQQDSLAINNPINNPLTSPIGNGHRNNYGLQASGGTDKVQYFLASDWQEEYGIYHMPDNEIARLKIERGVSSLPEWQVRPNSLKRINLRANLTAQLSSTANVNLSSGYVTSDQFLPQNEDNSTGLMVDEIAGKGARTDNVDARGIPLYGQFSYPLGDVLSYKNNQSVKRFTNSVAARWLALPWLQTRATVGLDLTSQLTRTGNTLEQGPVSGSGRLGYLDNQRRLNEQYSVDLGATASWNISTMLQNKFSFGAQYSRVFEATTFASGQTLPPGGQVLGQGAIRDGSESSNEVITFGTYFEDQVSINDKLFITGGLRGAYGASGAAPGSLTALRYFSATTLTGPGGGSTLPGIVLGALGNNKLKPEYSGEFEGGFDLGMFAGATNFELTYFSKSTKDALINRDIAPSLSGFSSQTVNIGAVKNAGVEFVLNQRIFDRRIAALNINITGSGTRNKLVTLGEGVSPIFTGNRTTQKNTTGYPLYGLWGRTYTINDRNGDGIVAAKTPTDPGDLVVTDTAQYVGNTYPKLELAISPSLEMFDHKLRFNAQFDHRGGVYKLNNTLRHQCQNGPSCQGDWDPNSSLEQQAAAVGINSYGILTGFYQDGAFTRFRELSVAYQMPDRLAHLVRAQRWNVVLTGRNLAVWTKWKGVDPETTVGNGDSRGNEEYFSTPPVRTLGFRMNFTF